MVNKGSYYKKPEYKAKGKVGIRFTYFSHLRIIVREVEQKELEATKYTSAPPTPPNPTPQHGSAGASEVPTPTPPHTRLLLQILQSMEEGREGPCRPLGAASEEAAALSAIARVRPLWLSSVSDLTMSHRELMMRRA